MLSRTITDNLTSQTTLQSVVPLNFPFPHLLQCALARLQNYQSHTLLNQEVEEQDLPSCI